MILDSFMKLKGIKGECTDSRFLGKGVIQLEWCKVGEAARETPWSKSLRAVQRILRDEEDAPKGPKNSVEAKLAKRENRMDRVALDAMLEELDEVDRDFNTEEFKDCETRLKKLLDNIQSVGAQTASDIKPHLTAMYKIAIEEKVLFEKSGGQKKEDEAQEEKKSCNIQIRKMADAASPLLFVKYCKFKTLSDESASSDVIIPSAKLWARKAGDPLVWKEWEFRTLSVTAFEWSSREDGTVEEAVSFTANSVRVTYRPQDITGKAITGKETTSEWDFASNTKTGVSTVSDNEVLS